MQQDYTSCQSTSLDLNCMVVGDSCVGKTVLCISYASNDYRVEHIPTSFDTYTVLVDVDGSPVRLLIHDVGGQPELSNMRQERYPEMHAILLCFSVVKPQSLRNLRSHWLSEISQNIFLNPTAEFTLSKLRSSGCVGSDFPSNSTKIDNDHTRIPRFKNPRPTSMRSAMRPRGPALILVGCMCDLRSDINYIMKLSEQNEEPIDQKTAKNLATEIGADVYIECSSLTQKLLKKVFDLTIWFGMRAYKHVNQTNSLRSIPHKNNHHPHNRGHRRIRNTENEKSFSDHTRKNTGNTCCCCS